MTLILWIMIGVLGGWAISAFMSSDKGDVDLVSIGFGVVGAVAGGWLNTLGFSVLTFSSVIAAIVGAVVLPAIVLFIKKK